MSCHLEGYFVRSFSTLPAEANSRCLDKVRYPPKEVPGAIVTEIGLWDVDNNVGSTIFSWSYWKSFFTGSTLPDSTYKVILHQKNPVEMGESTSTFLLHEATDLETSSCSFKALKNTIEPLVDDCTLMLTSGLLKEIILPEPIDPDQLSHHLTEVMESNPGAHPDWVKVMRALVLDAIGHDDPKVVDDLFDKVDVLEPDEKGNTLLHKAASAGSAKVWKRVTAKLTKRDSKKLLGTVNQGGKTPIQVAFQKNFPELVMAIMRSGVKLSDIRNEEGSCPLHLAAEAGSEESLAAAHHKRRNFLSESDTPEQLQFLDTLDSVDNHGFTPLMVAVKKGYVGSAVILMQAGADIDVQQYETGDTALHYAAKQGFTAIVKAIIAFRADIAIKNKSGKTALEEAQDSDFEDAEECVQLLEETTHLMEAAQAQLSETVEPPPLDPDSIILLSLDGGGFRGLITAQILIFIHERVKQLEPNCDRFHKYFDYVSGTSLGGLLVLSMVYLNASPRASLSFYFKAANELFSKIPNCPKEIVDTCMQETFGPNGSMSNIKKPRVVITTTRADKNPPELELLRNYHQTSEKNWKPWEVARATTAALPYFPAYEEKYIDGGFVANNPTLDAMVEVFKEGEREGKQTKIGMVLSLGTGTNPSQGVDNVDFFIPQSKNVFTSLHRLSGTVRGVKSMFHLLLSQSTRTDGQEVERASEWCKSIDAKYFRFSPLLSETVDLGETDKSKLAELMYIGYLYTLRNAKQLDMVARLLLSRPHV